MYCNGIEAGNSMFYEAYVVIWVQGEIQPFCPNHMFSLKKEWMDGWREGGRGWDAQYID